LLATVLEKCLIVYYANKDISSIELLKNAINAAKAANNVTLMMTVICVSKVGIRIIVKA